MHCAANVAALIFASSAALAGPPVIVNLGTLKGAPTSYPLGVSGDGSVVVGQSGARAFRWTQANGMQDLGFLSGMTRAEANGVSADGSTIVGRCDDPTPTRAFRWTADGGMQDLGVLPGQVRSIANGADRGGHTVIGYNTSADANSYRAFRWTAENGIQDLGGPLGQNTYASAISEDGSTIVGHAGPHAFRYTSAGGFEDLGTVGGPGSYGNAVSGDGSVVVGNTSGSGFAFRWTAESGMRSLGVPQGAVSVSAEGVSRDGFTVVGIGRWGPEDQRAVFWNSLLGFVEVHGILAELNVDLTGWVLERATAISGDGSTIVGYGSFNGERRAWLVTAPCFTPPTTEQHPASQSACPSGATSFSLIAGNRPSDYQWRWRQQGAIEWANVIDGVNNDPATGMPSFIAAGAAEASVAITNVAGTPATGVPPPREFQAIVTNPCGSATSEIAALTICAADFNCDTVVNSTDVSDFINAWFEDQASGTVTTDWDGNSVVNSTDVSGFINAWFEDIAAGCQ